MGPKRGLIRARLDLFTAQSTFKPKNISRHAVCCRSWLVTFWLKSLVKWFKNRPKKGAYKGPIRPFHCTYTQKQNTYLGMQFAVGAGWWHFPITCMGFTPRIDVIFDHFWPFFVIFDHFWPKTSRGAKKGPFFINFRKFWRFLERNTAPNFRVFAVSRGTPGENRKKGQKTENLVSQHPFLTLFEQNLLIFD